MTGLNDARQFLVELISQLFHADVRITEQAERIDTLRAQPALSEAVATRDSGAP